MYASQTAPDIVATFRGRLAHWVRHHDESWLFVGLYLTLAVGLSIFVSLFWLVVVAGFHFALELARQRWYRESPSQVFLHALWEVKLDIGLVLLALTLVLYIEVVLGILGLQSAARAGAATQLVRGSSRAAALEHWVRAGLLAVDEVMRVAYAALLMWRKDDRSSAQAEVGGASPAPNPRRPAPEEVDARPDAAPPAWRSTWGIADHIGLITVAAGILLILAAPYLTPHEWETAMATMLRELRPLPM